MTDELLPGIHRIEIPLPRNPLRAVNSYLIRGRDRWLMVDTGMNRPECLDAMRAALAALAVDLDRTDFFITHSHSDHIGLVSELRGPSSRVFLHSADAAIVLNPNLWTGMAAEARIHGFPNPDAAVEKHPGRRYLFTGRPEFTSLQEGDTLPVGDYTFRCIETPGHTPGHLCLWEPKAGLLFSGDHVLDTITPNISGWCCGADPLGEFLASLEKIATYDIRTILPGHRNLIPDPQRRIEELKAHHQTPAARGPPYSCRTRTDRLSSRIADGLAHRPPPLGGVPDPPAMVRHRRGPLPSPAPGANRSRHAALERRNRVFLAAGGGAVLGDGVKVAAETTYGGNGGIHPD